MTRLAPVLGLLGGCAIADAISGRPVGEGDDDDPGIDAGAQIPTCEGSNCAPKCETQSINVLRNSDFASTCKSETVADWAVSFGPAWYHYAGRPMESDNDACGVTGPFGCDDELGLLADSDGCLSVWGGSQAPTGTWTEVRQTVTSTKPIRGIKFSYVRAARQIDYGWKFGVYYEVAGELFPFEQTQANLAAARVNMNGVIPIDGDPNQLTMVIRLDRTNAGLVGHAWTTLDDIKLDLCHD
ncbi:MAG: hypothetical protein AB7P03_11640 [Kofleriaceae bacterium]